MTPPPAPARPRFELFRALPPTRRSAAATPHHLLLGERIVAYRLRRDRRRLALRIDERGLRVGAPRAVGMADIEAFIRQHAGWVLAQLDAFAQRGATRCPALAAGTQLPLLGGWATLRLTSGGNRGYWTTTAGGEELWLAVRPGADLAGLARRALQRRALETFRPRLAAAVARLGVALPPLALSSARTRWGSCSVRSGIRLNWRLIHLPPDIIDYVIAHEAAHLREMNHSPRFWAWVEQLCPAWRACRATLKILGADLPLL